MTARPTIIVLRALGLGDFLTGVPALRALRRAYPDHEIALAAPRALRPLAVASGAIDRVVDVPSWVRRPGAALPWRERPPDLAVNLHGRGPQSHRALQSLGPRRLLAFQCPEAGHHDGPPWAVAGCEPPEHEVARWCRMLSWHAIPTDPRDLTLPPPCPARPQPTPTALAANAAAGGSAPRGGSAGSGGFAGPDGVAGTVVIHPGASHPARRWPARRFAAVAAALADDGYSVVITGSCGPEEISARAIAHAAGVPPSGVLAGRTDLATLASVISTARLVICGDTGVAHLATAYGTPSAVLFGPASPGEWGPPPGRPRHVALWHGPDGLQRITVDEVLTAARGVIAATRVRTTSC